MRKYKKTFIVTCVLMLLPVIAGILLWNRLPDTIATHFGMDGAANGWSSKPFTVFGLPLFLLAVHVICVAATSKDPKHTNVSGKLFALILWICPVISLLVCGTTYAEALGYHMNMVKIVLLLLAILFIVIGNYLPKCKQNYTVGIKLPWTLRDEENWNRTHRMAGFVWVICGLLLLVNVFLEMEWLIIVLLFAMILVPTGYSFIYYLTKNRK